jgi:hypothetical protein
LIKRQLAHRFGEIPAEAVSRIDSATLPQLIEWGDRVLEGASVADVLGTRAMG